MALFAKNFFKATKVGFKAENKVEHKVKYKDKVSADAEGALADGKVEYGSVQFNTEFIKKSELAIMQIKAASVEEYMRHVPDERKEVLAKLRQTILDNLPEKFEETLSYGMVGYVVPHSIYPPGYHCDTKLPLPFMSFASQKNFVALYHMGIYADPELMNWFVAEYPKHVKGKLDMGKSCIRFKKMDQIPFELIAELVRKMSADQWIALYEAEG